MGQLSCIERMNERKVIERMQNIAEEDEVDPMSPSKQQKRSFLIDRKKRFCNTFEIIQHLNFKGKLTDHQFYKNYRAVLKKDPKGQVFDIKEISKYHSNLQVRAITSKELNFLKENNHAHLYTPYQIYDETKQAFLVYEPLKGGSLKDRINERIVGEISFSAYEIALTSYQIALAIKYMNAKGYIHRDIKPENIIFENKGSFENLKIDSFLTIKEFEKYQKCNGLTGTFQYMAPEMLVDNNYDEKVDVWSLGVLMYMLALMKHPIDSFKDKTQEQIKQSMTDMYLSMDSDEIFNFKRDISYSKAFIDLIKKMLEMNPKKRISIDEFLEDPFITSSVEDYKEKLQNYLIQSGSKSSYNTSIRTFNSNVIKKSVYVYFASNLASLEDKKYFAQLFKAIDVNGDGILSVQEFQNYLKIAFQNYKPVKLNMTNNIDLNEFVSTSIVLKLLHSNKEIYIRQMFDFLEPDENDEIEIEEIIDILKHQKIPFPQIESIAKAIDEDQSGKINFKEFKDFILQD